MEADRGAVTFQNGRAIETSAAVSEIDVDISGVERKAGTRAVVGSVFICQEVSARGSFYEEETEEIFGVEGSTAARAAFSGKSSSGARDSG